MPYLIMKIEQLHPYKQIWKHSFSSNVNAVILSQEEMEATEGEADPATLIIATGAAIGVYEGIKHIFKKWF